MRYTPQIEEALTAQLEREPDRPVILPDWAYWEGMDQPFIYVDRMPTPLMRHLHEALIGTLHPDQGLVNPPDVPARNVNPHLAVVTPTRKSRAVCPNGHRYEEGDYIPGVGHRCQTCRAEKLLGTPSVADVNRAKETCPKNHPLVRRPNGKRRCLECPRDQQRRYLEKKREHA